MFAFVAQLLITDFVAAHLVVDWLCIKITNKINKEFALKAQLELVILEDIIVDGINEFDKSNAIDKYKGIALLL